METQNPQPTNDHFALRTRCEEIPAILRFRYLPPGSLTEFDMGCELGLERLLYIQALITEDNES